MPHTTVVFVHGFLSKPVVWKSFIDRLQADKDFSPEQYSFLAFQYPTEFFEWDPRKRIAKINDLGSNLGVFLDTRCPDGTLILVGHSMGGLVIQSLLAQKIGNCLGESLARIRSVVLFATPNRGSLILSETRSFLSHFRSNPQEEDLRVLNPDIATNSRVIDQSILGASVGSKTSCPIPFHVYWGSNDNIVSEVSARGSFLEATCLTGGHSDIIQCGPNQTDDLNYAALKSDLLHPIGHPAVYEMSLLEVILVVMPVPTEKGILLRDLDQPITIHPDNAATRSMTFVFPKENRCTRPLTKMYRSNDGYVELLGLTEPNETAPENNSEYAKTGKKFTYTFSPGINTTFSMRLTIYNGFGEGQREWHDHLAADANCKLFRLTLDLSGYHNAGHTISPEPFLYFRKENATDRTLLEDRGSETLLTPVGSPNPWLRTWEMTDVRGGAVELGWDLKPPAM
jgi:hypothetical protein